MSQIYIHGSRLFTSIFSICGHPENMWSSNPPTKYEQMQNSKICVKPTPITDSSRLLSLKIMGFNFHFSFQKISPNNTLEKESNFEYLTMDPETGCGLPSTGEKARLLIGAPR